MSVEVSVLSKPEDNTRGPRMMQMSGVRSLSNEDFFKASLTNAYAQLPDDRPTLIVLRSFLTFGDEGYETERAVLGSQALVIPTIGVPYQRWNRNGFFTEADRGRVSAVGVLKPRWDGISSSFSLDIYHNDAARIPLDWTLLTRQSIRHLVRVDDEHMEWKGGRD